MIDDVLHDWLSCYMVYAVGGRWRMSPPHPHPLSKANDQTGPGMDSMGMPAAAYIPGAQNTSTRELYMMNNCTYIYLFTKQTNVNTFLVSEL